MELWVHVIPQYGAPSEIDQMSVAAIQPYKEEVAVEFAR
jgi:hypothetical protein